MKLTSIEIHPSNSSDVSVLSFRDPSSSNPYNVKKIVGLDADEIISRYYGTSGNFKFYNLSLVKREIVVQVGLNPDFGESESYSDLRDSFYKMISSSRTGKLQLQFKNDEDVIAVISGFVSKMETPHFEKNPEIQLSIICSDPMLIALNPTEVDIEELDPEDTTIQDDLSTAPHGFKFELAITDDINSLVISDSEDDSWSFSVEPEDGFLEDDVLYFSSEYNNKYLYLVRDDDVMYLADVITPGSIWPIIFPGENNFSLTNPTKVSWNAISYYPTYWGV